MLFLSLLAFIFQRFFQANDTRRKRDFCRPKFAGSLANMEDHSNINQSYLNADLFSAALLLVLYLQHLWNRSRKYKKVRLLWNLEQTWARCRFLHSSRLCYYKWRTLVFILLMSYFVQTPTFNHASPAQLVCRWFRHECKWDILSSKSPTMKR